MLLIYIYCTFVGIGNKLYKMHATYIKIITLYLKVTQFCHFNSLGPPVHTFSYSIRIKCSHLCTVPSTSLWENFRPRRFLRWYWKWAFDSGTKNESWVELIQNGRWQNFTFHLLDAFVNMSNHGVFITVKWYDLDMHSANFYPVTLLHLTFLNVNYSVPFS
jgi:hypothetical protein